MSRCVGTETPAWHPCPFSSSSEAKRWWVPREQARPELLWTQKPCSAGERPQVLPREHVLTQPEGKLNRPNPGAEGAAKPLVRRLW